MDYSRRKRLVWLGRQRYRFVALCAFGGLLLFTGMIVYESISGTKGSFASSPAARLSVPLCLAAGCLALFWQAVELGRAKGSILLELLDTTPRPGPLRTDRASYAVDGISIASGLPRPRLSIVNDDCLNAFTIPEAGGAPHLCLTSGLIESLSLEELTGVVAHEFAHIKNGDLNRFHVGPRVLAKLLSKRFRQRRWLAFLHGSLPLFVWLMTAAASFLLLTVVYADENVFLLIIVCGYVLTSLLFLYFLLSPVVSSREKLEERFSIDFVADRDALGWTFNPLAFQSALRKCGSRGMSDALEMVNRISFVCTRPEMPYVWRTDQRASSGVIYYSPGGIMLDNQVVREHNKPRYKGESSLVVPQQASVEHRLSMLEHYQPGSNTIRQLPFPDLGGEIPRHGT